MLDKDWKIHLFFGSIVVAIIVMWTLVIVYLVEPIPDKCEQPAAKAYHIDCVDYKPK